MAFENLFIRTKKSIGGVQLDAVLSETHNNSVRTTDNPVELGADITDHSITEPIQLKIVAEVSDTPLGGAAFSQIVDLVTGLFGSSTSSNVTRSNAAYNALIQIQNAREPIDVQTRLKLYKNMLITNINVIQDKDTSRIVRMNIELKEVIITSSVVVQLSAEQLAAGSPKEQAQSAVKRGRQEAKPVSEATNKSVLKSVIDWVGG